MMTNEKRDLPTLGDAVRGYYADNALPEAALRRLMAEPGMPSNASRHWMIAGAIAATIALLALGLSVLGRGPGAAGPVTPRLVAVQIHADWCARSPEVAPIFAELLTQYGNEPVLFVTLDITDDVRREQAKLLSANLGIPQAFDEPFQSGMIKLIDRESHRTLAAITGREQADELAVRIAEALGKPGGGGA
jgi:thiol-disulfide isomerase/thioredoxin